MEVEEEEPTFNTPAEVRTLKLSGHTPTTPSPLLTPTTLSNNNIFCTPKGLTGETTTVPYPLSDTSSALSPASSCDNPSESNLNLTTDVEFTDSESETIKQLPSFSPQRIISLYGGLSPSILPEGLRDTLCSNPNRVTKVRSRHSSFSTPPKSPGETQWRLLKVKSEDTVDDLGSERIVNQTLQLSDRFQDLTRQVERTDESSGSQPGSCPSSPRTSHQGNSPHHISSSPLRGNMISGGACILPRPQVPRSTTPSPSPPFTAPPHVPQNRCVSPRPLTSAASFTLKRKLPSEECASPPKRPCTMPLGHRSPTVEYRSRNHSPAPLSPLAVSSLSGDERRAVPIHPIHLPNHRDLLHDHYSGLLGRAEESDSSDDSPPRNNRQPG